MLPQLEKLEVVKQSAVTFLFVFVELPRLLVSNGMPNCRSRAVVAYPEIR